MKMPRFRELRSHVRWSLVLGVLVALAALVWMFASQGVAAGLVFAVALVAVVVALWNPWEQHPRPELHLVADGQTSAGAVLAGRRRALDTSALLEDVLRETDLATKGSMMMSASRLIQGFVPPSAQDQREYAKLVEAYTEQFPSWLEKVDDFLIENSRLLVADVVTTNDTKLDAEDARITLSFPAGFSEGELLSPPTEPTQPEFPYRRSALSVMHKGFSGPTYSGRTYALAMPGIQSLMAGARNRAPSYNEQRDGALRVTYPRQTIHHRERDSAGDELVVRLGVGGEHAIGWTASAANLPKPRHGSFTLDVSYEVTGGAIATMCELRSLLRELDPCPPDDDEAADEEN
jgi:hypothetical protein